MNIIEKLGIPQSERRYAGDYEESEGYIAVCRDEDVEELENIRDEMLEALIEIIDEYACGEDSIVWDNAYIAIIKATGKTWEEIKALL